ncbi:MAG TPA: ester cyclase [Gaiellaceae bacterium]|jgi:predicted ester cyclase
MSATNKEIVRRATEEPWRNPDVLDELVSPDYVAHDPAVPEPVRGIEGAKEQINMYRSAFEGAQITVSEQIGEGDLVATRWEGRGRHTGEIMGVAPTGRDVVVSGITLSRVEGGKIVEEWSNWDTLGMLQQVGAVPTEAPAQSRAT